MNMCADAVTGLDNITDIENFLMSEETVDRFTESIRLAMVNATDEVKMKLKILQNTTVNFNNAADNLNYELIDNLKSVTDAKILADDDMMKILQSMNDTGLLQLVNCDVAFDAKNTTDSYKEMANQKYQNAKVAFVSNIELINQEVAAITAELRVNPNSCTERVDALTKTLFAATESLRDEETNQVKIDNFSNEISNLAVAAQGKFTELSNKIKALAPQLAA